MSNIRLPQHRCIWQKNIVECRPLLGALPLSLTLSPPPTPRHSVPRDAFGSFGTGSSCDSRVPVGALSQAQSRSWSPPAPSGASGGAASSCGRADAAGARIRRNWNEPGGGSDFTVGRISHVQPSTDRQKIGFGILPLIHAATRPPAHTFESSLHTPDPCAQESTTPRLTSALTLPIGPGAH